MNEKTKYLQSTQNVRKYVMIVMWGFIFFTILKLVGSIINLFIFAKYDSSLPISAIEPMDELFVAIIGVFNLPWLMLWLVLVILYSGWIHRSYTNLVKHNVQGLRMTPAWAVGWNFMPILQLFKPFQVMKEIYLASFYAEDDSEEWKHQFIPSLFLWWWLFLLIGIITFVNWFVFSQTFIFLQLDGWLSVISAISFIISGVILLKLMKQVTDKQVSRFKEDEA